MRTRAGFAVLFFLASLASNAVAQKTSADDKVHWCSTIPISDMWRESQFTAVFVFDVDARGKPIHIKGIHMPLIEDDSPIISCISSWSIPSASGRVTAAIKWKWSCLDILISSNGNHRTYPCQPPKPTA